jgi:hypothetical protein
MSLFKLIMIKIKKIFEYLGCIDPSEPFQCPQSERCIALQFICDGHPGDCPGNTDENEETCIAGKTDFLKLQKKPDIVPFPF